MTSEMRDKWGRRGAVAGGFVLGFFVFGAMAIRFFYSERSWEALFLIALIGAAFSSWCQVRYGNLLWYKLFNRSWW